MSSSSTTNNNGPEPPKQLYMPPSKRRPAGQPPGPPTDRSFKSNLSKCPSPFELAAYDAITHCCEETLLPQASVEFNENDASKVIPVTTDLLHELTNAFSAEHAQFFLQAAAQKVGKTGHLGAEYKFVEFDFVGYINESQPCSSSTAGSHEPSSLSTASPHPQMPAALKEILNAAAGDPPILAALVNMHLRVDPPFVSGELLNMLPEKLKESLVLEWNSLASLDAMEEWVDSRLKDLNSQSRDLIKAYRGVKHSKETEKDSPETERRKVVLWEIQENSAVDYALVQLERRIIAYTNRRQKKSSASSLDFCDCIGLCGIHVQKKIAPLVTPCLSENRFSLPRVWKLFKRGLFKVSSPEQGGPKAPIGESLARKMNDWNGLHSSPTMAMESLASHDQAAALSHYVRVHFKEPVNTEEVINITRLITSGEVTPDIAGLKEAVLKKFPIRLQGKEVADLPVYAPDGEKVLKGHVPLSSYPSSPGDESTFYICRVT